MHRRTGPVTQRRSLWREAGGVYGGTICDCERVKELWMGRVVGAGIGKSEIERLG